MEEEKQVSAKNESKKDEYSPTAYDDAFHTLLLYCTKLIIPVVNEIFQKNYSLDENVKLGTNEYHIHLLDGSEQKRINDSSFTIGVEGSNGERYHIECEANMKENSILFRLFEYDSQIALHYGKMDEQSLHVNFPRTAVLALHCKEKMPDSMPIYIKTNDGEVKHSITISKVQKYSLNEIFDKNLLFFIPYYILKYEKELREYEKDDNKINAINEEYKNIKEKLNELVRNGNLQEYYAIRICEMTNHVMKLVAKDCENLRKKVSKTMGGKIIPSMVQKIRDEALDEGEKKGEKKGFLAGEKKGRDEGLGLGRINGLAESVNCLVNNMNLSIDEAMKKLDLDSFDRKAVADKINEMKGINQKKSYGYSR